MLGWEKMENQSDLYEKMTSSICCWPHYLFYHLISQGTINLSKSSNSHISKILQQSIILTKKGIYRTMNRINKSKGCWNLTVFYVTAWSGFLAILKVLYHARIYLILNLINVHNTVYFFVLFSDIIHNWWNS